MVFICIEACILDVKYDIETNPESTLINLLKLTHQPNYMDTHYTKNIGS